MPISETFEEFEELENIRILIAVLQRTNKQVYTTTDELSTASVQLSTAKNEKEEDFKLLGETNSRLIDLLQETYKGVSGAAEGLVKAEKKLFTSTKERVKKIGELKEELKCKDYDLRSSIQKNNDRESRFEGEIGKLKGEVDKLKDENRKNADLLEQLRWKNSKLEDSLRKNCTLESRFEGEIGELKGEVDKLKDENRNSNDELQRQHHHVNRLTQAITEQAKNYETLNQLTKAIKDEAEKLMPEKAQQGISLPNAEYAPVCYTGNSQTSEQSMELEVLNVNYGIVHSNLRVCYDKLKSAYHHESKLFFGFVTRKAVSYIEDGVAFAAFVTDAYLMSLGEGHHYKKKRFIANVIGFIVAISSMLSTSLAILVEAKFYDVEWNQRWFYKGEKPYIPLFPIGDLIVTLGSAFLLGNTIPLWTIQLKASVYDFCSGIGIMCFFFKFLKAINARVLRRWWWTGAD